MYYYANLIIHQNSSYYYYYYYYYYAKIGKLGFILVASCMIDEKWRLIKETLSIHIGIG